MPFKLKRLARTPLRFLMIDQPQRRPIPLIRRALLEALAPGAPFWATRGSRAAGDPVTCRSPLSQPPLFCSRMITFAPSDWRSRRAARHGGSCIARAVRAN
jgi:hypothetical protein